MAESEVDRMAALLARFRLSAGVYYTGALCGVATLGPEDGLGHLHLLRSGRLTISGAGLSPQCFDGPVALLLPRPRLHRLETAAGEAADMVCATIAMGGPANPLQRALPPLLSLPLSGEDLLHGALALLFTEAAGQSCGRQAVMDRLAEVAFICLLRRGMAAAAGGVGLLAGLAHPALARVLVGLHEEPGDDWTLETMADRAGMSRSVFAQSFRDVVGTTPADYLRGWRLHLAGEALAAGQSLKQVARDVGYASHTALSRALSQMRQAEGVTSSPWS